MVSTSTSVGMIPLILPVILATDIVRQYRSFSIEGGPRGFYAVVKILCPGG